MPSLIVRLTSAGAAHTLAALHGSMLTLPRTLACVIGFHSGRTPFPGPLARKILRFGRTRSDTGIDLNNLLNTNYATQFNTTYVYNTDNVPRPSGWATPTGIYNPLFVRLNFTVNF